MMVTRQVNLDGCRFCNSENVNRDGFKILKRGKVRVFRCRDCGRKFTHNLGFEKKQSSPEQITLAVDMVFGGLSSRKAAEALNRTGGNTSHMTVFRRAESYAGIMTAFADKITLPRVLVGGVLVGDDLESALELLGHPPGQRLAVVDQNLKDGQAGLILAARRW